MDRPDQPRASDIFEHISGYPQPPPVPLPDLDDLGLFTAFDIRDTPLARQIVHGGMTASGFTSFVNKLKDDDLEALLRAINLRIPGLFAPVLSATSALLDDPRPLSPFQRAATLIFGAYSLYHSVMTAELEPDNLRSKPLEMGQYPNLFSTSMILEGRMPSLFKSVFEPQISVLIGGRIYLLQLGDLETETWVEGLATALEKLASQAQPLPPGTPALGLVTAANSPTQMRIFNLMAHSPTNAPNLRALRRSFLTLCLDLDGVPETAAEAARLAHSTNFANRWFHSSLQLVVFGNARACLITSFTAYLDGNVMTRSASEIQKRAAVYPLAEESTAPPAIYPVQELTWELTPQALPPKLYQRAQEDIHRVLDPQIATFELADFGVSFFETLKLSPVPAFILALQAATSRLAGHPAEINQFASLSAFRCMDVIQVMVSTPAVKQFAQAMELVDLDVNGGQESALTQARALLQPALESQAAVLRKARGQIPTDILMMLYARTRRGSQQIRAQACLSASVFGLILTGQMRLNAMRDVIVSHPTIYPEVLLLGRPGARLPYVKSFGLHYQIWPDKTVLTVMPGQHWQVPNAEVADQIAHSLRTLARIVPRTG
jgi:hypothetical protein